MLNRLLLVTCIAACTACSVSGDDTPTDSNGTSGHITSDTTWSADQQILVNTTIDAGATVTVAAGTALGIKSTASITVAGTLRFVGTSASKITVGPADGAVTFQGIEVANGGVMTMSYTTVTGGSVLTTATANLTILDSQLSHADGDLLIMNGGTIDVEYSAIGVDPPATDSSHCDLHFGGLGNVIRFEHSNASTASYGAMFYSGMAAYFSYDKWFSNQVNVDLQPGVNGDFSNSYFQGAQPTGNGITINSPSTGLLPVCTGTNDTTCAGPRP